MPTTLSSSEARASLPDILDRVANGEEIVITRHGRAVAVVVNPAALRTRRAPAAYADADADRIGLLLAAGRDAPLPDRSGLAPARADELVAGVRADRDASP